MLESIKNTITNIQHIHKNYKPGRKRRAMLSAFTKISINLILNKFGLQKKKKERILGYKINFFTYDIFFWLFYEIFVKKEYEFHATTKKPSILDCGSNIGMSILFFKKLYPEARIIGFEPDEKTFQILKKNIQQNKLQNITLHQAALSNKKGTISFFSDATTDGKLAMSITKQVEEHNITNVKETKVQAVKLSEYINKGSEIDFVKMDIEGAELLVLQDLDKEKKLPQIKEMLLEYHFSNKNPTNTLKAVLTILEKNKFEYRFISELETPFYKQQTKPYNMLIYAYNTKKK